MRRSVLAAIGTVAGTALMLGAKLGTPPSGTPEVAPVSNTGAIAGAGGPSTPVPAAGSGAPAAVVMSPGPGNPTAQAAGGTTAAASPPTAGGRKDGKYTASSAVQRYGYPVSVAITVSGGRVTAATGTCGGVSGQSLTYCSYAMSRLQQETLAAQSATVNTVSGATYTSMAYRSSLQAALDQA